VNADTSERSSEDPNKALLVNGALHGAAPSVRIESKQVLPVAGELAFHYQPIFDAGGQAVIHEALVRWHRPGGGVRAPVDFLHSLLEPERIAGFTAFTIACAVSTLEQNPGLHCISINLSPNQLCMDSTLERLDGLSEGSRERLMIEVTEDPITDRESYHLGIGEIANLGVNVVLDDVVPEDIEQRLLNGLAVSGVKFDRSVLPRLIGPRAEPAASLVLKALRQLKLHVTIEGIDDVAALPQLASLGATRFQGFGLAMPGPYLNAEHRVGR